MRTGFAGTVVALFAFAYPVALHAELQNENILIPLPNGFKVGWETVRNGMKMTEFIPATETVDDWSRMVTEQIFYGRGRGDPDALPAGMVARWNSGCPGGSGQRAVRTQENGYSVSVWMFNCPNNPATGKPENMWMKAVAATDSLYIVQYAYRSALSKELVTPAMSYLRSVLVCDKRGAAHPCPSGM
jgi:hypothetical protein